MLALITPSPEIWVDATTGYLLSRQIEVDVEALWLPFCRCLNLRKSRTYPLY